MSRDVSPLNTRRGKNNQEASLRKSKLDTPHIKQQVIKRLAVGEKAKSIAKDVGLSHSQIYRFESREDIKALIEHEQRRLVEAVPDAVENVKNLVREMKTIPKPDIKRRELSYKASLDTLKAVGIMPSQVQSQFITNIFQQTNLTLSPVVQALLDAHDKTMLWEDQEEGEKDKEGNEDG